MKYVKINERVNLEMPFSEVCMHMKIAGKIMEAELVGNPDYPTAQLYKDGKEFSFPILYSEAGFYRNKNGFYYHETN